MSRVVYCHLRFTVNHKWQKVAEVPGNAPVWRDFRANLGVDARALTEGWNLANRNTENMQVGII